MSRRMTKITTSELILSAIFYLQQKNGVTAKEITKYICEKRGCAQKHMKDNVKKALERATVKGIFCRKRGLYRINNGFGLNKILLNKNRGRGKKSSKVIKPRVNVAEKKIGFQICFEEPKDSEPMLLNEMVDERMNDVDHDKSGIYIELPMTFDEDDDDDDADFEDTEDDDEENDFFSDVDENGQKTEPKTLFINENLVAKGSDCNSFTDPFRKVSRDEYPENGGSEERLEEKESKEDETRESETPEVESIQERENSKESSENPSESVRCNDGNQSGDEDQNNEEYGDQQEVEMDWDCQLKDLECIDRLLKTENYPVNVAQRKQAGSDTACENSKGMKLQKNNSRIKLSIKDDPTDIFETCHMNEST